MSKKTNSSIDLWVPLILLLSLFICFCAYNITRKKILVVHSYDTSYSWVRDMNEGLKGILDKQNLVKVQYHYMDTKRHPDLPYKQRAGYNTRRLINLIKPDVIIGSDDDAQHFVNTYFLNRKDIHIVFCGVNASPETYNYHTATNVTGILERIPLEGLRDALLLMAQKKNKKETVKAIHISDTSSTVQFDDQYIHSFNNWGRVNILPSKLVDSFDHWKKAILNASNTADFIIVSNYRKVKREEGLSTLVSPEEVMQWTMDHAKVPVIGANGFVVMDGGALAIATSPYEQGEQAALLALSHIENKPRPETFLKTKQFIVYMNPALMKKKNIELTDIYQAFSRATKKIFEKEAEE
jgi:ABC-type uncharacterized transport system substrate-binding protein